MGLKKKYQVSLYLDDGEKFHFDMMDYKETYELKKKLDKDNKSYRILKNDDDVTLYFK